MSKKQSKKRDKKLEKILFQGVDPKMQELLRPSISKLNNVQKGALTLMVLTQRLYSDMQKQIFESLVQIQPLPMPSGRIFYPDIANGKKGKKKKV